MYCPRCRAEYRAGFTTCAHCKIELVAELPPADVFASPEAMAAALAEREVQALLIGSYVDLTEAQRFLASKRVASVVASERGEEGEAAVHSRFFLMVAAADLAAAREVIRGQRAMAPGLLLEDAVLPEGTCPACGTAVSATMVECPECGLFLGDAEGETAG